MASVLFILLEQKNNLNLMKKVCKNKDFGRTVMPSEKDSILEFNQYMMSDKMRYIIESLKFFNNKNRWANS